MPILGSSTTMVWFQKQEFKIATNFRIIFKRNEGTFIEKY